MVLVLIFWGVVIGLLILWIIHDNKKRNERHIDQRGYERDGYGRLVHRSVAYRHHYSKWKYPHRFGEYDIHHKDRNKRNNDPENLEILTREEHKKRHGF